MILIIVHHLMLSVSIDCIKLFLFDTFALFRCFILILNILQVKVLDFE